MSAAMKLILGVILVLIGLWLLVPSAWISSVKPGSVSGVSVNWGDEFLIVLKGLIPPFLVLIGALVVWIESEEMKAPEVPEIEEDFEVEEELEEEVEEESEEFKCEECGRSFDSKRGLSAHKAQAH
jgi:hypothetical protein